MTEEIIKRYSRGYNFYKKNTWLSISIDKGVITDYLKSDLNMKQFSLSIGKSKSYATLLSTRLRKCNAYVSIMLGKGNDGQYRYYFNKNLKVPRTRREKDRVLRLINSYIEKQNYLYEFIFIDDKHYPKHN